MLATWTNEGNVPPEQTIIAVTAVLAGLLLVGVILAGRRAPEGPVASIDRIRHPALSPPARITLRRAGAMLGTLSRRCAWCGG